MMYKTQVEKIEHLTNEVKLYSDLSKDIDKFNDNLKLACKNFYLQLHAGSTLVNRLPNIIIHRKINIQSLIKNTLSGIDSIMQELQKAKFECEMCSSNAKHQLIIETRRQENEERANAKLAK